MKIKTNSLLYEGFGSFLAWTVQKDNYESHDYLLEVKYSSWNCNLSHLYSGYGATTHSWDHGLKVLQQWSEISNLILYWLVWGQDDNSISVKCSKQCEKGGPKKYFSLPIFPIHILIFSSSLQFGTSKIVVRFSISSKGVSCFKIKSNSFNQKSYSG